METLPDTVQLDSTQLDAFKSCLLDHSVVVVNDRWLYPTNDPLGQHGGAYGFIANGRQGPVVEVHTQRTPGLFADDFQREAVQTFENAIDACMPSI
ncbi:hypothetical protein GF362_05455 [Candidatus Dojkabacteria bacterium]|nr:hypothetical protein [Candidatus Dojkabacteria bacterium]